MRDREQAIGLVAGPFQRLGAALGLDGALTLSYRPRSRAAEPAQLAAELAERIASDLERGFTGHGPHRDELTVLREGRDLRIFGSQGQQRLALLALLLGRARGDRRSAPGTAADAARRRHERARSAPPAGARRPAALERRSVGDHDDRPRARSRRLRRRRRAARGRRWLRAPGGAGRDSPAPRPEAARARPGRCCAASSLPRRCLQRSSESGMGPLGRRSQRRLSQRLSRAASSRSPAQGRRGRRSST